VKIKKQAVIGCPAAKKQKKPAQSKHKKTTKKNRFYPETGFLLGNLHFSFFEKEKGSPKKEDPKPRLLKRKNPIPTSGYEKKSSNRSPESDCNISSLL